MHALILCAALGVLAVIFAAETAQAMISPANGAYDGRGKSPDKFKVLPGKPKRHRAGYVSADRESNGAASQVIIEDDRVRGAGAAIPDLLGGWTKSCPKACL